MRRKFKVYWSQEASDRVDQIIEYLLTNWSEKEVDIFLETLFGFENYVSRYPYIFSESETFIGYRKAVLLKQISVIYSVEEGKIKVHTVFDNRQDTGRIKIDQ